MAWWQETDDFHVGAPARNGLLQQHRVETFGIFTNLQNQPVPTDQLPVGGLILTVRKPTLLVTTLKTNLLE